VNPRDVLASLVPHRRTSGTPKRPGVLALALAVVLVGALAACSSGSSSSSAPSGSSTTSTVASAPGRPVVYFDENEEQDVLSAPNDTRSRLIDPWDPNGQMCTLPDGRFVVGYNPTLASQHNPGSARPVKAPPVGEALYHADGSFSGQTLYVPGPYHLPGQKVGGDIPPDTSSGGAFNDNGTFTGCAIDHEGNVFGADLGTAQGDFPSPDDGRLIEWFAPSYRDACVVLGPTSGGTGPHHVDGHGGLRQPGDMAVDAHDDLYLPESGNANGQIPAGRILKIAHAQLPTSAADCPGNVLPANQVHPSVFFQGSLSLLPFPMTIARDPTCKCWAVDSVFGNPAVVWLDDQGHPIAGHATIPGESLDHLGDPNGYNPFGLAIAPNGAVYVVDIHIHCDKPMVGCGPASRAGRELKFTIANGKASAPKVLASGLDFPTSVTVCVPSTRQVCPARR
jgi:hypothetical protein